MSVNSNLWYNSLNWLNLYDADAFIQFRGIKSDSRAHLKFQTFPEIHLNFDEI